MSGAPSSAVHLSNEFVETEPPASVRIPSETVVQLSSMLDYDIDNTLNSIKESDARLLAGAKNPTTRHDCAMMERHEAARNSIQKEKSEGKVLLPPTPPSTPVTDSNARKRWRILAKVLRKDSVEETNSSWSSSSEDYMEEHTASVRRFKSFDLLRQDSFEDHVTLHCLGKPENWYKYSVVLNDLQDERQEFTVNIHHVGRHLTASDLIGFNNTGNICVWPSEEALTAYVLSDVTMYSGKWILELGGGFTCLAGLMLSKYAKPYAVHLTDGNEVSIENVRKSVCLNDLSCYTKCSVLKWEDTGTRSQAEAGQFDVILSADCLFFDEARSALIDTIHYYLNGKGGLALVMAPKRGRTMQYFIEEAKIKEFEISIIQRYNETIWKRHLELKDSSLYDEDLHYPILLQLRKRAV